MMPMHSEPIAIIVATFTGIFVGKAISIETLRWPQQPNDAPALQIAPDHVATPLAMRVLKRLPRQIGQYLQLRRAATTRHKSIIVVSAMIGALALAVAPNAAGITGAVFGWVLLALLVLDVEHYWLPNRLTVPLAVSGLAVGLWLPPALSDRVVGCVVGFVSLATIAYVYKAITGRTGLGGGDPRLFAGIGAWLGWSMLPFVLLLASILGLALVGYDRLSGLAVGRHSRVPLGAFLAAAAWIIWLFASMMESGRWF